MGGSRGIWERWSWRRITAWRLKTLSPQPLTTAWPPCDWMREHADELGIDADRIAVTGASAGGGLAAAVAQRSHDEGIALRAQGLVYPMLDDRTVLKDDHEGRGRLSGRPNRTASPGPRTSAGNRGCRMRRPTQRLRDVTICPNFRPPGSASAIWTSTTARTSAYAQKLRASGVPCELVTVPRMYHAADGFAQKAPSMEAFTAGPGQPSQSAPVITDR